MKIPFKYYMIALGFLAITACNQLSEEEKQYDALMQQVIDVHDEVMPKMGEISALIKTLEPKIDTTATGTTYANAQKGLKNSYDAMMGWMGDFSTKFPHDDHATIEDKEKFDQKMKMLQEEETKVNDLKKQINSSIDTAQKLLKNS